MTTKTMNNVWRIVQLAILFILILLVLRISPRDKKEVSIKETVTALTDTIRIRDTIEVEKPVYISRTVVDSILVSVEKIDTVFLKDTLYIQLPREQRHYRKEEYEAWVSGFQPELDSLKLYTDQTLITNQYHHQTQIIEKQRQKRFGIGIQVGYGATFNEKFYFSPYVGIGLSYNFLTF